MKKSDFILCGILLLASFFISAYSYVSLSANEAETVVVAYNGEVLKTFEIDTDSEYDLYTDEGFNRIVIKGGEVYISDSDCKGGDCIKSGAIDSAGERIVCLPHKLEIYLEGGNSNVDTVAY